MKYIFALLFGGVVGCQTQQDIPPKTYSADEQKTVPSVSLTPLDIKTKGAEIVLSEQERVWELISWTTDVKDANRQSEETGRPIFLFSMHGDLDGRC